jgi:hypothetical protein
MPAVAVQARFEGQKLLPCIDQTECTHLQILAPGITHRIIIVKTIAQLRFKFEQHSSVVLRVSQQRRGLMDLVKINAYLCMQSFGIQSKV